MPPMSIGSPQPNVFRNPATCCFATLCGRINQQLAIEVIHPRKSDHFLNSFPKTAKNEDIAVTRCLTESSHRDLSFRGLQPILNLLLLGNTLTKPNIMTIRSETFPKRPTNGTAARYSNLHCNHTLSVKRLLVPFSFLKLQAFDPKAPGNLRSDAQIVSRSEHFIMFHDFRSSTYSDCPGYP